MTDKPVSYADSGVNIDAGDAAVDLIVDEAKRTHVPGVLSGIGGFGGLFSLKDALGELGDPVLVSGTDGVGTKLLVAVAANRHESIGQDLVAMCVNDVLTSGARPLFFLDYYATGKLSPTHMAAVVSGIARACAACDCALIGGETAELPGLYSHGHYDLAGFAVGVVDRKKILDGTRLKQGDSIIGLASSGLHSNGYSLARKVIFDVMDADLGDMIEGKSLGDWLLEPTRLYVRSIVSLLKSGADVRAMAHITGGGLPENLTRGFPSFTGARVDPKTWHEPAIFDVIRRGGPVVEREMRRTFNLGIGFCVVVPPSEASATCAFLHKAGEDARVIGEVTGGAGDVVFA